MSTAMMSVEGVLGDREAFSPSMLQRESGSRLFFAIQQWYRLVLVSSHHDREQVEWWLAKNGIKGHAEVLVAEELAEGWSDIDIRARQLRTLRANRTAVELVIDPDPLVVTMAMTQGITGLLFGPGRVGTDRLDLRRSRRDWDSIEAEIDHQRTSRPVQTAETP